MNEGERFLHKKYSDLHTQPEVEHEQERREVATEHDIEGQEPSDKPAEKIGNFLEVIARTHGHHEDPRVLERIKASYHKQYVIKPEEIPQGYFELQRRLAREQGHGDVEITDEMRNQLTEVVIADQESSLDKWVDYLSSEDADAYPMWAKYWSFRSMLKLATYDKEKHAFGKRDKGTTAPFPDLNREALAYVVDAAEKKQGADYQTLKQQEKELKNKLKLLLGKKRQGEAVDDVDIRVTEEQMNDLAQKQEFYLLGDTEHSEDEKQSFQQALSSEDFGKLYAWAIEKVTPAAEAELQDTRGEWVKYEQNSDHMPLVESLQGHGTGWCTAGESTAEAQLKSGDFYVYYSMDKDGKPTIPRTAIRMEENRIAEVRGVAAEQNLDPHIGGVVEEKLKEFGQEGEAYQKKSADMKQLTLMEKKVQQGQKLDKDDLIFIYEINTPIEGFGYQRDPRIEELRTQRNPEEDMPIVFDCTQEQIARTPNEINENTRAYVGKLELGIFQRLPETIEHVYTQFPEKKIRREQIEIGGKTVEELEAALKKAGVNISDNAAYMLHSKEFVTSTETEEAALVRLTGADLGFENGATTDQIYQKAQEIGLELCPAETGPHYRLQYKNQPMGEWIRVGMKPISDSGGGPRVFGVVRRGDGLWLRSIWAEPDSKWDPDDEFVFRLRKSES